MGAAGPTLVIATLGFHENYAIRVMNAVNAGEGDYIAAVTVKPPAAAVRAAWDSLRSVAQRLGVKPLDLLELDPTTPEDSLAQLIQWIHAHATRTQAARVIIDATGGARILATLTLLAAIPLTRTLNIEYWVQSDTGAAWQVRVDKHLLNAITTQPSPEKTRILQAILENPGAHPTTIAEKTGIHPKTLLNHLAKLKKQHLVIQKGRKAGLHPTPKAKLILTIHKLTQNKTETH